MDLPRMDLPRFRGRQEGTFEDKNASIKSGGYTRLKGLRMVF